MKEQHYRWIGWAIVILAALLCLNWGLGRSGLTGFFIGLSQKLVNAELVQISWLLTFAVVCIPAWMLKNYFEGLAWQEHVKNLPPPDVRETAKKSKYVKTDHIPVAPKPVQLSNIPEGQEEFVITCAACGQFFSAKRGVKELKCPNCGEPVPVS